MFRKAKKLSNEDHINLMAGFLPQEDQVLQIIAATGFNAKYKVQNDDDLVVPLIAWAFLKNGAVLPVLYDHKDKGYINARSVEGFMGIIHDKDTEEIDEDDDEIEFKSDF